MNSDVINKLIGDRIATLRKQNKLSQQSLADSLGIARTSIGNMEKGRHQTSLNMIYRLADFFKVKIDSLLPSIHEVQNPDIDKESLLMKALEDHSEIDKKIILDLIRL